METTNINFAKIESPRRKAILDELAKIAIDTKDNNQLKVSSILFIFMQNQGFNLDLNKKDGDIKEEDVVAAIQLAKELKANKELAKYIKNLGGYAEIIDRASTDARKKSYKLVQHFGMAKNCVSVTKTINMLSTKDLAKEDKTK